MATLRFDSVTLTYEGSDRSVRALDSLSLEIGAGEPVAVIGPSGCGKSTLLLLAAGLLAPSAGRVLVDGGTLGAPRRETALILQDFGLLPWKTVEANAGLGLEVRGVGREERRSRSAEALARVGLADFAHSYPAELSGGMRQRLGLARQTVANILGKWRRFGWLITGRGRIMVLRRDALQEYDQRHVD